MPKSTSCVNLQAWHTAFTQARKFSVFSQGAQDSVLASLFSDKWFGTGSKYYVEFGFNTASWSPNKKAASGPNTQYLHCLTRNQISRSKLLKRGKATVPLRNISCKRCTCRQIKAYNCLERNRTPCSSRSSQGFPIPIFVRIWHFTVSKSASKFTGMNRSI